MDAVPSTVKAGADRTPGQEAFTPSARWVYVFGIAMTVVLVGFIVLKFTAFGGM